MTEPSMPTGLQNLPPLATPAPLGGLRFLQAWLAGPGRWVGWLIVPLVPIFMFSVAGVYAATEEFCLASFNPDGRFYRDRYIYDDGCIQKGALAMSVVSLVFVLFAAICMASTAAMFMRPKRSTDQVQSVARLQGAKDWYIRGDIAEEDYQALRGLIESTEDPKNVGAAARWAATLLRSFAFFLLPFALFWFVFITIFIEELPGRLLDELVYVLNWFVGALPFITLFVLGLVRSSQLKRFSAEYQRSLLKQVDAAEEQIMRTARSRTGHRDTGGRASGASFRAYASR